jgi:cell division protein FtsI (penicillin-binding protein 3)/stage V sporulation protein D (sporulation-specific penicillin-binding protein)
VNHALQLRAVWVLLLFAVGFTVVSARLIQLQILRHAKYQEEAMRAQCRVIPVPALRGRILDCQRRIFAQSVPVVDLYIDGKLATEDPGRLDQVARLLGLPPAELRARLSPARRNELLQPELDPAVADQLRALNPKYRPLIFTDRIKRVYPNGWEGSHVIGFTNQVPLQMDDWEKAINTEQGMLGIEQALDYYLAGRAGERRVVLDKTGREIPAYRMSDHQPQNGCDIVLTIDQVIQHAIEEEADQLMRQYTPATVSILVLRPATGEVLGLTNRPTFDPGNRRTMSDLASLRNCTLTDIYEPGSTFKIVTAAAVLSEGVATLETPIYCENGAFYYAGTTLRDTHENGTLTVRRALEVSSNIAFAKLGLALGPDKLYRQIRLMGFGERAQETKYALPGEQKGLLRPTDKWSKISLTRVPIGYEIGVTNLQMTMAMASVANGGQLVRPLFIKAIVDANGRVVREFAPQVVRRVIPADVAAQLRQTLAGVVSDEGTAQGAQVEGWTVAGKTGTARKFINGHYEHGAYYSSFIGFVPADQPQFLISIMVNQPRGQVYGGKVAGPAFSSIATKVAQQLNMIAGGPPRELAKGAVSR